MATELWFDLPGVVRLAEHAAAAAAHFPTLTEHVDGRVCAGALEWAADDGTYLTSNGSPSLLADPADSRSNVAVYAHGWGPGSDRAMLGISDVGHDDFTEHLHLFEGPTPLIDRIRQADIHGYRWMVLTIDDDDLAVAFRRTDPTDPFISL